MLEKKNSKTKKVINNLEEFYNSREEVISFFRELKCYLMQITMQKKKKMKLREKDLKY